MTTVLSDETKENFRQWIQSWDDRINTYDDLETQKIIHSKMSNGFWTIARLLNESDSKAMVKATIGLLPNSNEFNKASVEAMFENQDKKWNKDLKRIQDDLNYVMCILDNIYELKNRRTYENIKLRAELAKFKNGK